MAIFSILLISLIINIKFPGEIKDIENFDFQIYFIESFVKPRELDDFKYLKNKDDKFLIKYLINGEIYEKIIRNVENYKIKKKKNY